MCIQYGSRALSARTVRGPFRISGMPLDGLVALPGPSGRYMQRAVLPMLGACCVAGLGHEGAGAIVVVDPTPPNCMICPWRGTLSASLRADISPAQHETFQRNSYRRNNMYSQRARLSPSLAADRLSCRKLGRVPCVTMPFEKEISGGCSSPFHIDLEIGMGPG